MINKNHSHRFRYENVKKIKSEFDTFISIDIRSLKSNYLFINKHKAHSIILFRKDYRLYKNAIYDIQMLGNKTQMKIYLS